MLGHVHAVRRGGEADAGTARGGAVHAGDGPVFGRNGPAEHPGQRSGPVWATGNRDSVPRGRPRPHRHHRPFHERLPGPHRQGVRGVRSRRREVRGGTARGARAFLAAHPNAKPFVETPKPIPTSFAREAFFAVTSFKFTNAEGISRHGRFRIRPEAGTEYLSNDDAAAKSANFLFDEIGERLARGPIRLGVFVQMAEPGDEVADASITWPDARKEIPFGTISLTARADDQVPERRRIIFDPLPRIDGIDSSGDPLTDVRADVYLLSGRRRRAALGDGR